MDKFKEKAITILKLMLKRWYLLVLGILCITMLIYYNGSKNTINEHFVTPDDINSVDTNNATITADTFILMPYVSLNDGTFIKQLKKLEKESDIEFYLIDTTLYNAFDNTDLNFSSDYATKNVPQYIIFSKMDKYTYDGVTMQSFSSFKDYILESDNEVSVYTNKEYETYDKTITDNIKNYDNFEDLFAYCKDTLKLSDADLQLWEKNNGHGLLFSSYGYFKSSTLLKQINWVKKYGIPSSDIGTTQSISDETSIKLSSMEINVNSETQVRTLQVTLSLTNTSDEDVYIPSENFSLSSDGQIVPLIKDTDAYSSPKTSLNTSVMLSYTISDNFNSNHILFTYNDNDVSVTWKINNPSTDEIK